MSTIFQKYAAALLPFFILVIGASQTVLKEGPVDRGGREVVVSLYDDCLVACGEGGVFPDC